jgi:hypothetical protein
MMRDGKDGLPGLARGLGTLQALAEDAITLGVQPHRPPVIRRPHDPVGRVVGPQALVNRVGEDAAEETYGAGRGARAAFDDGAAPLLRLHVRLGLAGDHVAHKTPEISRLQILHGPMP